MEAYSLQFRAVQAVVFSSGPKDILNVDFIHNKITKKYEKFEKASWVKKKYIWD